MFFRSHQSKNFNKCLHKYETAVIIILLSLEVHYEFSTVFKPCQRYSCKRCGFRQEPDFSYRYDGSSVRGHVFCHDSSPEEKQKEEQQMRDSIEVGDEITTIGGIVGRVVTVKDDSLIIETGAERNRIKIMRWAISTNNTANEKLEAERAAAKEAQEAEKAAKMEEAKAKSKASRKKSKKNKDADAE